MAIAGIVRRGVKFKEISIYPADEVTVKIVKEILSLFKVEVVKNAEDADYELLVVESNCDCAAPVRVATTVSFVRAETVAKRFYRVHETGAAERPASAKRRVIKLNLYHIFVEELGLEPAPWGILHGIRPTKLVHQYIDGGMGREDVIGRLKTDYEVREKKAVLLADLALRQRAFLATTAPYKASVYIGIPFCLSRCLYCSFPSYVLPKQELLLQFLQALEQDILKARAMIERNQLCVQNIYIGGGTPTSLPAKAFSSLLDLVSRSFIQAGTLEFTVEAGRPDSVDNEKIAAMMAFGVNRVSVNPQTMQEKTLKHIGRNHSVQDIIDLFGQFRRAGRMRINMDLIVGLPGEDCADMEDTMRQITQLEPDNITLHALALKRGSSLKSNRADYTLPDDRTASSMFDLAAERIDRLGMRPYYLYRQGYMSGNLENIGFSMPGAEGLYNIQIMEERQTIIGIGPAATTKVIDHRDWSMRTSFNPKDLTTYLNGLEQYMEKRASLLSSAPHLGEELR